LGQAIAGRVRAPVAGLAAGLQAHFDFARESFGRLRKDISASIAKHQLKLADR
jgi:hypothetical protein